MRGADLHALRVIVRRSPRPAMHARAQYGGHVNIGKSSSGSDRSTPARLLKPSDVSSRVGFFDRFAGLTAQMASRAPFFACCLLLVLIWLVQGAIRILAEGSFSAFLDGQYQ